VTEKTPLQEVGSCFMCEQYKPHGCLECRTHRLISDIRTGLYDKMGLEQNRAEWEERALKAESHREEKDRAFEALLAFVQMIHQEVRSINFTDRHRLGDRAERLLADAERFRKV